MNFSKEIIIHCSASPNYRDDKIEDINRWHIARGFKKVGYHYVIELDGSIRIGRKENEIGAHCLGHNNTSIGICLIGTDQFTNLQISSLVTLIQEIEIRLPDITIHGHYEFANKTCPNINIKEFCQKFNL